MFFRRLLSRPNSSRRVLVVDDSVPKPEIGAGAPRALALLRALSDGGLDITMYPALFAEKDTADIQRILPRVEFVAGGDQKLRRFLRHRLKEFSIVIVSRPHNMRAFRALRAAHPGYAWPQSVIYDAEAIFAEREVIQQRVFGAPYSPEKAESLIAAEIALAQGVTSVLAVNEDTAVAFRRRGHQYVNVLGYALDVVPTEYSPAGRTDFLFVGPTYDDCTPNSDSVVWFADQVLPRIRAEAAAIRSLKVVGRSASVAVAARAGEGLLDLRGPVSDLRPVYDRAMVFVAPTRFAAGIPLKVYDAAAHGVPIVMTSLLARQINWRDGEEALVADTPEAFAQACLRLSRDHALWKHLSMSALRRTAADCDRERFTRTVVDPVRALLDQDVHRAKVRQL